MTNSIIASVAGHDLLSIEAFLAMGIWLFALVILIIAITDLRHRNISALAKVLWMFLVVLIPGIGGNGLLQNQNPHRHTHDEAKSPGPCNQ